MNIEAPYIIVRDYGYENDIHDDRIWKVGKPGYYSFEVPHDQYRGLSIVIIPGGAYKKWNPIGNGVEYAKFLNIFGINCYIAIPSLPGGTTLHDTVNDMTLILRNIQQGNHLGIMGCSAGGHLAATMMNNFPKLIEFGILLSPVISMINHIHTNTMNNIQSFMTPAEQEYYSCDRHVTESNPRCLIMHNQLDAKVDIMHSVYYYKALHDKKIKSEVHIFQDGEHDFQIKHKSGWSSILINWLRQNDLIH